MNYGVVITAFNEDKFIGKCIDAIFEQSVEPLRVIVVDDNSEDGTFDIALSKGADVMPLRNPRIRQRGINQALAIRSGVHHLLKTHRPDNILKIDADSIIPRDYSEILLHILETNQRIGVVGGVPETMKIRLSRVSDGARMITKKCWVDCNGYSVLTAFDSHFLLKAKQLGYETITIPELKYQELRPSLKYGSKRWIDTGRSRKEFNFPLLHTILAGSKNALSGSPKVLNSLIVVMSYLVSNPERNKELDADFVRNLSKQEIVEFSKEVLRYVRR